MIVKPLVDGAVAVALFNAEGQSMAIRTDATSIGMPSADCYSVRDLWEHTDSTTSGSLGQTVPAHGVAMLRVTTTCH